MPIISTIGRRQPRMRAFIALLYVVLILGALTMVYPFLLMISLSFASPVDQHEFVLVPRYWYDEAALFRKYEESKYDENLDYLSEYMAREYAKFEQLRPPRQPHRAAVRDWRLFARTLPLNYTNLAHQASISRITPESLWRYWSFLQRKFHGDLEALNRAYREAHQSWTEQTWAAPTLAYPVDLWQQRQTRELPTAKYRDFLTFKRSLPDRYRIPVTMDGLWWSTLRTSYGKHLAAVSRTHGRRYRAGSDFRLSPRLPALPGEARDWLDFVRQDCPFHFVRLDPAATSDFRRALRTKYGSLAALNQAYHTSCRAWDQVPAPTQLPRTEPARLDWSDYISSSAPAPWLSLRTPEILYREWLAGRYQTIGELNRAYGTRYGSFAEPNPPRLDSDWLELQEHRRAIRTEFVLRNYRDVFQYIVTHGRAIWNTVVLVAGLLLVTLVVNPLAAYALSRYQLPATYKILLFLLATMAFPAEVTMIPGFLLLKSAHLLNTYWALILPAMASGYSIFLLKGFFDSLPRELYESALIDGAPEHVMFIRITVPLSKPVLAVIALGTFGVAYGSFMWAFLVCQDPKMWTLMVWLFQMQIWAPQFMIMAALVLAAIPTLLVFIFCQNIIMRGIILPVEK